MASNETFGKAAMVISADSTQLVAGLNEANNKIGSFIVNINSKMSYVGHGIKGAFVGIAATLASQFGKVFGDLRKEVENIASEAKLADRLGIGMERFSGLMAATRLDATQLSSAMLNVANLSARASQSTGRPGGSGGRSGQAFQQLRIDPKELRLQSAEDQFRTLGTAISKLNSPMEQNRVAMRLFGEQGANVVRAFSGDIDKAIEEAKRLGLVISDDDARAAQDAQKTFKETERIVSGAFRQMAVAFAPVVQFLNNGFKEWREITSGVIRNVADGFKAFFDVVKAIFAELGESTGGYLQEVKEFWSSWKTDIPAVKDIALSAFRGIGVAIGWVIDRFAQLGAGFGEYVAVPVVSGLGTLLSTLARFTTSFNTGFIQPLLRGFDRILAGAAGIARLDPTGALGRRVADARAVLGEAGRIPGAVAAGLDNAAGRVNNTLLPAMRAANAELAGRQGASANIDAFFDRVQNRMRQGVQQVARELDGIDPLLQARATQLTEKFKSPLEALKTTLDELGEVFEHELIDSNVLGQAMQQALSQAESALKIGPEKHAGAALAGSKEAVSAIYRRDDNKPLDVQERIRQIQERQLALAEINTRNSADMVAALRNRSTLDWI